jgi:hypothetical protein
MQPTELLRLVSSVCEALGLPYFVSGSVASTFYGEYRSTRDVDIVVELRPSKVAEFCAAFPEPEFYVSVEAAREAVAHGSQFNIIHPSSGFKIDIMLPEDSAYSSLRFERARRVRLGEGFEPFFSAPEDIILMKMKYYKEGGSDKHLRDIASMLKVSGPQIDQAYLAGWAARLGVSGVWTQILSGIGSQLDLPFTGSPPPRTS